MQKFHEFFYHSPTVRPCDIQFITSCYSHCYNWKTTYIFNISDLSYIKA
jgi:hypothetical protein